MTQVKSRPKLSERFPRAVPAGDTLVLVGEEEYALVPDGPAHRVLRLVDGTRTEQEIVEDLSDAFRPEIVHYLLIQLYEAGYIVGGTTLEDRNSSAEGGGALRRDAATFRGSLTPGLHRALADGDVPVVLEGDRDWGSLQTLDLWVADDYLDPRLNPLNRRALAEGRPWLMARLTDHDIWLGPFVIPGETSCLQCLTHRLAPNYPARVFALHWEQGTRAHVDRDKPSTSSIAKLARYIESLRADDIRSLRNAFWRIDRCGTRTRHAVPRISSCSHCGEVRDLGRSGPITIRSAPKTSGSTSGFRSQDPLETFSRFRHLIDPFTGVVRTLNRVTVEGGELIHTYTASHALNLGAPSVLTLKHERRDHSGGKGSTDIDARVSALCEALERYSAAHRGDEPSTLACLADLAGRGIAPNDCLRFSEAQFESRDEWNERIAGSFQWIAEPLQDATPVNWTPLWSLSKGTTKYLPTSYLYFGYDLEDNRYCRADSNGLAAGNCMEEAILQGFLELVERDAVAIWWYNRTQQPQVDLESFSDQYIDRILGYYGSLDRAVWALDVTSDLKIPCFVAVSARQCDERPEVIMGFGAHLDPEIALRRAVTELNQALPAVLRSDEERRKQLMPEYADALHWWDTATLDGHPYLVPNPNLASVRKGDLPYEPTDDLRDDIHHCLGIAHDRGLETLVLDHTREDIGLHVAKVVVPGLRHFWRRLGAGRLYEVPVALGRLEVPLDEEQLNPVPLFL